MAELCRTKVSTLAQALEQSETRVKATEALRGLIDAIILMPAYGELKEGEPGGDAWSGHKCEEVARNGRPLAAS